MRDGLEACERLQELLHALIGERDGDLLVAALERDVAREVEEAVAFAEAGTLEPVESLLRDVTTPKEMMR